MVYSQPPVKTQQPSKEKASIEEQENLFHVRIQITKYVVNTIINLGSQNNIISEALVQKLGMKIDKHPEPYQLGLQIDKHPEPDPLVWLQKDVRMQITHQCKFKFSISANYIHKFECDVVPLNICEVVFVSP